VCARKRANKYYQDKINNRLKPVVPKTEEEKKAYRIRYRKENADIILKKGMLYRENNREKLNDDQRNYRKSSPDRVLKSCEKYKCSSAKYESNVNQLTIDESPRLASNGVSLEVKCRYCGKYFIPTNLQVQNRKQSLRNQIKGTNNLYCSGGCKQACPIFNQQKWPKEFKPATSRETQPELRQLVLLRDNYTCQKCGAYDNIELHCHHIYPLNESPIESADVNNCITLCKECHKETHKISGCNYYELRCSA